MIIYLNDGVINPIINKTIKCKKKEYYSDDEIIEEFLSYEDPISKAIKIKSGTKDDNGRLINTNRMYYSSNNKNVYQLLGLATDSFGNILDNVFRIRNIGIIIEEDE